jgi:hypothetical protein
MPGQEAAQQARRGAGVAQVDHVVGRQQTTNADPVDPPSAGAIASRQDTEAAKRCCGAVHVVAFKQTQDYRFADRKCR